MRQHMLRGRMLARAPLPEDHDFVTALRTDRRCGQDGAASPTSAPGSAWGGLARLFYLSFKKTCHNLELTGSWGCLPVR
jgi:hypothetical protein